MMPLVEQVISIARDAAAEILAIYESDIRARTKADGSAVTDADERASAVIRHALARLAPTDLVVCEEAHGECPVSSVDRFWLVDPLDGTKEFVARKRDFTVNIALIERGQPVLGVVLAPALGRVFAGAPGYGAFLEENGERTRLACRRPPREGLTVVASRSHGDAAALEAFLHGRAVARTLSAGSSLKFCMVASGEADLYPRLGPTMEWDTAAGHAVLCAAGGRVTCVDGGALGYGKPGLLNPHFIAAGL